MTLQVPFVDLAATAKRYEINEVYLQKVGEMGILTGCNPATGVVVQTRVRKSEPEIRSALSDLSIGVYPGSWSDQPFEMNQSEEMFVAAVSYKSVGHIPGLWIDAYSEEPTHVQVLEAIYAEFRETGEMPEVTIEEFIRGANPNVVVTTKSQLEGYIQAKSTKVKEQAGGK